MSLTDELMLWSHQQRCEKAVEALGQNGFTAVYCNSSQEAHDYILRHGADAGSIGFGGSRTIVDLGVEPLLAGQGKEILNHGTPGMELVQKMEVMRCELEAMRKRLDALLAESPGDDPVVERDRA